MTTASKRAILTRLNADHRRIELLTENVLDRFDSSSEESWERIDRADVAASVDALRNELFRHIDEEREGGCVDEALSRAPTLSTDARAVYRESDELQEQMQEIVDLIASGAVRDARNAFLRFAKSLRLHEEHEQDLVKRGLSSSS